MAEERGKSQSLEDKVVNLLAERTTLLQERTERNDTREGMQKHQEELRQQTLMLAAELNDKDDAIHLSAVANKQLEEEIAELRFEAQTLVEDSWPSIIAEYRRSEELKNAVAEEYSKGYVYAKGLVASARVNPITLGFSSDEDASDGEGQPSVPQDPPIPLHVDSPSPKVLPDPPGPQNPPTPL